MMPRILLDSHCEPIQYSEIFLGFEINIMIERDYCAYTIQEDFGESYRVHVSHGYSRRTFENALRAARFEAGLITCEIEPR